MPASRSPSASIVIPTRARPAYLEVALASIAPQAAAAAAEVLVIDDDDADRGARIRALAERFGARYVPHERPLGLNIARNTGVSRSTGALVVFVDDDIEAHPGWLAALLGASEARPDVEVFTGPIRARLEGRAPRGCGREAPPITTLELGAEDTDARYAWGANMAIRRDALERIGAFDVTLRNGGDEQEWQDRLRAREPGARVLYVAAAVVDHRRAGADARLRALARAQYARGAAARRFDASRGSAPSRARELMTLVACLGHVARRRCPAGLTMAAHSAGRLREALRERRGTATMTTPAATATTTALPVTTQAPMTPAATAKTTPATTPVTKPPAAGHDDFLSGTSGTVGGIDGALRGVRDRAVDAWELASAKRLRLDMAARHEPPLRRVLAIGVVRPERGALAAAIRAELLRSRHEVALHTCPPGTRGKFENLNTLLAEHPPQGYDWLLVVDDDVELPRGFLDRLLFLCERFELALAQPAHRLRSHAAWPVTRRKPGSVVHETELVEIGPVTAFARATFATLLPFPDQLRMGWGLDAHWAALARTHGWRRGVVDAVAIGHHVAPVAESYARETALAEAREFLAKRPYLRTPELQRTLTTHRRW